MIETVKAGWDHVGVSVCVFHLFMLHIKHCQQWVCFSVAGQAWWFPHKFQSPPCIHLLYSSLDRGRDGTIIIIINRWLWTWLSVWWFWVSAPQITEVIYQLVHCAREGSSGCDSHVHSGTSECLWAAAVMETVLCECCLPQPLCYCHCLSFDFVLVNFNKASLRRRSCRYNL